MCLARKATAVWPPESSADGLRPLVFEVPALDSPSKPSKRRRSLWELSASAACPVLGVCVPMCEQRALMHKCGIDAHGRSDYELHQIGVSECRRRTPLAERLQKWLDGRFALELRQVADCSSADELRQSLLQAEVEQNRLLLRCQQLLAERPDFEAMQALRLENADLRQQCQQASRILRAVTRQCGVGAQQGQGQPSLATAVATSSSEAGSRSAESGLSEAGGESKARSELAPNEVGAAPSSEPSRPALAATKVACIGGRTAQWPAFREVVEAHGAQLLHHDGGDEHHLSQLPATLAAADWVICQVGCISHNAYWRVKDHCKRTGKPCLYVESTSRSALERAMQRIHTAQHAVVCPAKRLDA